MMRPSLVALVALGWACGAANAFTSPRLRFALPCSAAATSLASAAAVPLDDDAASRSLIYYALLKLFSTISTISS